jgi:hypothetical protein
VFAALAHYHGATFLLRAMRHECIQIRPSAIGFHCMFMSDLSIASKLLYVFKTPFGFFSATYDIARP